MEQFCETDDFFACIKPDRFIPFDLGVSLSSEEIVEMGKALACPLKEPPRLLRRISHETVALMSLDADLDLYVSTMGVGVFCLHDAVFVLNSEWGAEEYCKSRKDAHHAILKGEHPKSRLISGTIKTMRGLLRSRNRRITAKEDWQHGGLSYVMTTTCIEGEMLGCYSKMDDVAKANLQILLSPNLAFLDDDRTSSTVDSANPAPIEVDIDTLAEPVDYLNEAASNIYISWAAVVLYSNNASRDYRLMLESLEVDLQIMWMYVYCLNECRPSTGQKGKRPRASVLRRESCIFLSET